MEDRNILSENMQYLATHSATSEEAKTQFLLFISELVSQCFLLLLPKNSIDHYQLDEDTYWALNQFLIEQADSLEDAKSTTEIDWDRIEESTHQFHKRAVELFPNCTEKSCHATIDLYEKYLLYKQLYPDSRTNLWEQIKNYILRTGFIFNLEIVQPQTPYQATLGLSKLPNELLMLDDVIAMQAYTLQILQNSDSPLPKAKILSFLAQKNNTDKLYDINKFKKYIIKPLQQVGLIATENFKGYFFVRNANDLKIAHQKQEEELNLQIEKAQKKLRLLKLRGKAMGVAL
ncbi:MAG: hypothetical protein JJT94_04050 [Bernardetiaceae bacterium]|nr:hypothetical protein [Bernardetiaceae bacterium]